MKEADELEGRLKDMATNKVDPQEIELPVREAKPRTTLRVQLPEDVLQARAGRGQGGFGHDVCGLPANARRDG
jgi:hypothetical protein